MFEWLVAAALGAVEPAVCEGAGAVRMAATRSLIEGRPVEGLSTILESDLRDCPLLGPVTGQLYAHLGDWESAARYAIAPQRRSRCATQGGSSQSDGFPAIDALVRRSAERNWVIVNESHFLSSERAFMWLAAEALHEVGFRYLAVEDLTPAYPRMVARGYVSIGDGADVIEPQFALFLERAMALGYELVAYEAVGGDMRPAERERGQARNLAARINDPDRRVLVFAGAGHGRKDFVEGEDAFPLMAYWLAEETGEDPLSVAQDACPLLDRASSPFVVLPGDEPEPAFDLIVRNPRGPEWTASIGLKRVLPPTPPEAFLAGLASVELAYLERAADAAPADRVLLRDGVPVRDLYALPGRYRVVFRHADGDIEVLGAVDVD
jgi:hypothetical protein